MKKAVAGDREVALELEEHLGMVELRIRLQKVLDRLGMVFFSLRFSLWGLTRIIVLGEQHLMPPLTSVLTSSTALHAFAVPFISPISRFADLLLRSPVINSLVSNSHSTTTPALRDFFTDAREGDSPGPSELSTFLCVSFCCREMKSFEEVGASQRCITYSLF